LARSFSSARRNGSRLESGNAFGPDLCSRRRASSSPRPPGVAALVTGAVCLGEMLIEDNRVTMIDPGFGANDGRREYLARYIDRAQATDIRAPAT
jgi:hypothetical protein